LDEGGSEELVEFVNGIEDGTMAAWLNAQSVELKVVTLWFVKTCHGGFLTHDTVTGWWFGTFSFFHSVGNVIIPTDSYFSEG